MFDEGRAYAGRAIGLLIALVFLVAILKGSQVSQVTFDGPVGCSFSPAAKQVTLRVPGIVNKGKGESGKLEIRIYASDSPSGRGEEIKSMQFATVEVNGSLDGGEASKPFVYTAKVDPLPPLERPQAIQAALLEGGKIVDHQNIAGTYTFLKQDWLKWYERFGLWQWVGIAALTLFAIAGVSVAGIPALRRFRSRRQTLTAGP